MRNKMFIQRMFIEDLVCVRFCVGFLRFSKEWVVLRVLFDIQKRILIVECGVVLKVSVFVFWRVREGCFCQVNILVSEQDGSLVLLVLLLDVGVFEEEVVI